MSAKRPLAAAVGKPPVFHPSERSAAHGSRHRLRHADSRFESHRRFSVTPSHLPRLGGYARRSPHCLPFFLNTSHRTTNNASVAAPDDASPPSSASNCSYAERSTCTASKKEQKRAPAVQRQGTESRIRRQRWA